jgi:hypothetical protein
MGCAVSRMRSTEGPKRISGKSDSIPREEEFDLIIVGGKYQTHWPTKLPFATVQADDLIAGPTGLLAGLLARQLNLKVCIFDAKDGPLKVGGADAITARSQQYLEVTGNFERAKSGKTGMLHELLERGIKCNSELLQ